MKRPSLTLSTALEIVIVAVGLLFATAIVWAALVYYRNTLPLVENMPLANFKPRELNIPDLDRVIKLLDARRSQFTGSSTPPDVLNVFR
ncbi:MAG: hypothetical protein HYT39_02420 [Candidatus Sungbacteria bacterium]|nr:hypothetical protein [Candidatus Sungbacteria bacterium]